MIAVSVAKPTVGFRFSGIFRIVGYAFAALAVVMLADRLLSGDVAGNVGSSDLLSKAFEHVARIVGPLFDTATTWAGKRSWRPFLMATAVVGIFASLVARSAPPSKARAVIESIGAGSVLLFLFGGMFYGLFVLTGSWHSARMAVGLLAVFLVASLFKRG